MQPIEMDSMRLWILMTAGGVFAIAGILLMFRAKQEGSSARLELFGQKFEASSAGIIVFLIGAAFLAAPVFVPERSALRPPPIEPPGKGRDRAARPVRFLCRSGPAYRKRSLTKVSTVPIRLQWVRQYAGAFRQTMQIGMPFPPTLPREGKYSSPSGLRRREVAQAMCFWTASENQVGDDMRLLLTKYRAPKVTWLSSDQYYIRVEGRRALYEISLKYQ